MPRIVIIEHDDSIALLLHVLLTEHGYEAVRIDGPGDLLAKVSAATPALVLLDLFLGNLGHGLELAAALRADPRLGQVPIIVLSAARSVLRQHAHALQVLRCRVLEKPFNVVELLALVETTLHEPRGDEKPGTIGSVGW